VGTGATILVVDDDPGLNKTLSAILRAQGYSPLTAADGRTAVDMIGDNQPDVALIDLKLPDINGLAVMERIREGSPDTECIVLTGYASQATAIEAIDLGAYSYVQKPYDPEQLLVTIRRALEKRGAVRALRDSEHRYRQLVDDANDIIYSHDLEGNFTSANPAARRVYGYTAEEILRMNIAQIVESDYLPLAQEKIREKVEGSRQTEPYELLTHSKAGTPIWVEVSTRLLQRDEQPVGVHGIARDITDRKQAQEAVLRLMDLNEGIVQNMAEGIVIEDAEGHVTFANPTSATMLGYEAEELVGQHWTAFTPPDQHQILQAADERRARGETDHYELQMVRKDGKRVPVLVSGSPRFEGGRFAGSLAVFTDITESKRAEETIRRLAHHDALTGLPNRALFNDRLSVALAPAQQNQHELTVMLLDLDHFKEVNDTLGHTTGDQLLQAVGQRLTTLLRESDTDSRVGGDEFLLLLAEASAQDACRVGERILEALRKPVAVDGRELRITASIGIAVFPDDGENTDTLVKSADAAMYRAKEQDRDNVQLYASLRARRHAHSRRDEMRDEISAREKLVDEPV